MLRGCTEPPTGVADARHPRRDNPLFYEEVNYAASAAFQRLSDFDFDDDQEMRRRLPRLFRSIHSASRDLSSPRG